MTRRSFCSLLTLVALAGLAGPAQAAKPTMSACLAANESAIKLRGDHKLRASREQSLACAAVGCPKELRDACLKRAADVNALIPSIVFEVKDANGNDVAGASVTMDGELLAARLDGAAVPLDPGEHTFTFVALSEPTVEKHFVIYEGATGRHETIILSATGLLNPPPAPVVEEKPSGLGPVRLAGLTLAGVGVAGIVVGSVFGALTFSSWSSATAACGSGGAGDCSTKNQGTATADHTAAVTDGAVSTAAFIAGGALAAAGIVMFLTGGPGQAEAKRSVTLVPVFGPGNAGLSLGGTF